MARLPRGTLLNFATVATGALIGLLVGNAIPSDYKPIALSGLGLVTMGIGVKLFLQTKSALIVAASIALGGLLGHLIGIDAGLATFAEFMRQRMGGGDAAQFNNALVATSVLFCVGPMTLLGCMEDALENKIELLSIKATLDFVAAIFFAGTSRSAALGVLVTSGVVLVSQSALTFGARSLQPLAKDESLLAELSAAGGTILMAIGLGLLEIRKLPTADYLPALALAPAFVYVGRRVGRARTI